MALSEFIHNNMEAILQEWGKFAQSTPQGAHMDTDALRDDARDILCHIANDISTPQSPKEQELKSKTQPEPGGTATSHASVRRSQGFDLNEMVAEYRALRASVVRLWTKDMVSADTNTLYELVRFDEAIDESWVLATARYDEELSRSRELLLGILGHDLRTPLGAILMSARVMLDFGQLNEINASAAKRILNSGEHIQELVTTLLDATRLSLGGSLPVAPEPSDLSKICSQVVEEVKAAHPTREIKLKTVGNLQGVWDYARLNQLLSNLLANAVQHGTRERPVSLTVNDAGDEVLLRVHNEGRAIPPSAQARLFEPAIQSDRADPGHLGLGLYVVRSVAEAHGGSASVDSSEEHGTTFIVNLPRNAISSADPAGYQ